MRNSVLAASLLLASTSAFAQTAETPPPAATAAAPEVASERRVAERDLFERVVKIPTVAGRGEMPRLTALIAAELREAGITNIVIKDHVGQPEDATQTLIARWPAANPSGAEPILLMAHMDVVEANRADWTHDPFEFREAEGYYWGRGTNDNKAGMVAIVLALQNLSRAGFAPSRDIIVLFTGDEETEQNGARLAATEWRDLIGAEYALNSDAGGGSVYRDGRAEFVLQLAEKIYADYRFVTTNRGGHSSAPRLDNAIYALAGALKRLEEYRFAPMINDATRAYFEHTRDNDGGIAGELAGAWLEDIENRELGDIIEIMDPGSTRTRCVATELSGGHAPNALPQRAEATVNCRIFPGVTPETIRAELQAITGQDVTVELTGTPQAAEASPMRQDVVDAYRAALATRFANASILPWMSAGATDAAYLRAEGIPVYGVGGLWGNIGEPYGAHGLDERVLIEGFHDQMRVWEELLRRLAG